MEICDSDGLQKMNRVRDSLGITFIQEKIIGEYSKVGFINWLEMTRRHFRIYSRILVFSN